MGNVDRENLNEVMRYHPPPTRVAIQKHERVWNAAERFADELLVLCPDCKDREKAIEHIRAAKMWANSAIALDGLI